MKVGLIPAGTDQVVVGDMERSRLKDIKILFFAGAVSYTHLFSEVGGEHRKILEDTGKSLVLRKLAEEKKDELTLLGGNLRKLGYISEVKSLLSEFVQYRIEPEDLTQIMEQNKSNPQLYFKLKDMKVIYESFRQYLKDTYLTAEELLKALEDTVEQSRSVRNSVIVLDGYHGFTPCLLYTSVILQPCPLHAAIVVSDMKDRLSPNIAPPITVAIQSGVENPEALDTAIPMGTISVIVPTDVPMALSLIHI